MANNSKQQILTLHTTHGDKYDAATEQEQNVIGQRIAKARTSMGLSLTKVSALLEDYGVSIKSGAISKWELGKAVPSAYQLLAVSQALQMEDDLYQYTSTYAPALNEAGMKKVAEYKADLIASGK